MNSRSDDKDKTNLTHARSAQSSLSDAKRWGSIPPDWVLELFESHRVNPDWLTVCQEPMLLPRGNLESIPKDALFSSEDMGDCVSDQDSGEKVGKEEHKADATTCLSGNDV
jgi:hypothetical protein